MNIQQEINKLQQLIASSQFEAAFQQLSLLLPVHSAEATHLVMLENTYWSNLRDEQAGVASPESVARTRNQVAQGLMELLQSLSEVEVAEARPSDFKSAVAEIRSLLVRQERIPHAFARLEELLQPAFEHYMQHLSPLRVQYTANHTDHVIAGTLEREKYLINLNRIVRGIEELISKLSAEYAKLNGNNFAIDSDLAVVSCNRKRIIRLFWQRFEAKTGNGQPALFYLLGEQKYGHAESLVRRLITNLKEEKGSVKYSSFNKITIPLIDFMADDAEEDCRFSLKRGFNRGLRPEVGSLQELMSKIDETHYPQFNGHRYIPWVLKFNIPEKCWQSAGRQTLHWFIEQFCRMEGSFKQTLVFFLIINLKPAKSKIAAKPGGWRRLFGSPSPRPAEKSADLPEDLQAIAEKYTETTTALPPLALVREEDLLDWYRIFEPNERVRERKVAEIISQLPPGDAWHMADVEEQLQAIVEAHRNSLHGI